MSARPRRNLIVPSHLFDYYLESPHARKHAFLERQCKWLLPGGRKRCEEKHTTRSSRIFRFWAAMLGKSVGAQIKTNSAVNNCIPKHRSNYVQQSMVKPHSNWHRPFGKKASRSIIASQNVLVATSRSELVHTFSSPLHATDCCCNYQYQK